MNITKTIHADHTDVKVTDSTGRILESFTFDTTNEANAFIKGMSAAQRIINGMVQSFPISHQTIDLDVKI